MSIGAFDREGTSVDLDEEEAAARWQAGEIAFHGDAVPFRASDGSLYYIDNTPEELRQAFSAGMSIAPQEEVRQAELRTDVGVGEAFAGGLGGEGASGLSAGISEQFARVAGREGRDAEAHRAQLEAEQSRGQQERFRVAQEEHPIAGTAGRLTGDLALLAATGGGSLAAAGGRAAGEAAAATLGEGLLARAGASALRMGTEGAIEGAILGTRDAAEEVALGDNALTGERLAAHVGMGTLLGFAGGAALGGGGRLLGDVGEAAARRAQERATQAFPALQRSLPDALQEFARGEAFRALRPVKRYTDRAFARAGGPEGVGEVLLRHQIVRPDANLDTMAEDIGRVIAQQGDTIGAVVRRADEVGTPIDASGLRAEIDSLVSKLRGSNFGSGARLANRLEAEMTPLLQRLDDGQMGLEELWMARRELDDIAYRGSNAVSPNPLNAELQRIRASIEDTVDATIDGAGQSIGEDLAQAYRNAKRDYSALALARDTVEDRVRREASNRSFSLTDYLGANAGAVVGGIEAGPVGMAVGFLTGRVHKWWRENNRQILAGSADRMSQYLAAQRGARTVAERTDDALGRWLERAAGVKRAGKRAARGARKVATALSIDDYNERVKAVQEFAADPVTAANRLASHTARFSAQAPNTAGALHQTAVRGAAFLEQRIPPGSRPRGGMLATMRPPRRVSDAEMARFMRYARAVEDPATVIEDMEEGRLSREGVEALKEVYPKMYEDVVQKVMEALTEPGAKLPAYEERIRLGILLGIPADPSLEPGFVARMQASYAPAPAASQAPAQPAPRPAPGIAEQSLSDSQRLEEAR